MSDFWVGAICGIVASYIGTAATWVLIVLISDCKEVHGDKRWRD